jgi:hypothetical protein
MTHEQETPVLSVEHWNYQMAMEAGHPEIGEMGMFIDVAVIRKDEKILRVQSIKELKIEWERFKRDEVYASGVLQVVEAMLA